MAHGAFGFEINSNKSSFTEALQKVVDTLSKIGIRETSKLVILRYMKEEVPTNSMGQSSSTTGPIKTVDPLLKRKPLKRLKAFLKT
jgi:hypothetical protein